MPSSNLRFQSTLSEPVATGSYFPSTSSTFAPRPVEKKQKMSLTQTYYIAASARSKLGREASRHDHNLRLLVGHANLLDSLMLELANAEREQEAWFNQTVQRAAKGDSANRSNVWADSIKEEEDISSDEEDFSDSDSEFDEEEFSMIVPASAAPRMIPTVTITSAEIEEDSDEDDEFYYDEEDDAEHALVRTVSHPVHKLPAAINTSSTTSQQAPLSPPTSPPELVSDDSLSSSEDDLSEDEHDDSEVPAIPPYSAARKQAAGLSASEQEQITSKQSFYQSQNMFIASY